jgi:septal ring factor EnvC (AmiA/AmiB activator)
MNQTFSRLEAYLSIPIKHVFYSLFFALLIQNPGYSETQQELQGVKKEISRQQSALSHQSQQLDKLQNTLKNQELNIASFEKQIASTQQKLKQSNKNLAALKHKITQLRQQKKQQSEKLKQLLNTYYMTRYPDSTIDLFKESNDEDRISQYYQYLAKARTQTIHDLEQTQQQLHQHELQIQQEHDQIQSLLNHQTEKFALLKTTQKKRQVTIRKIRSKISSDKNYLSELQRNESRLKAEIAKAAKQQYRIPMNGLAGKQGKLPWPIHGKILHRFGTHQTGQLNWKGIVISAVYGQQVKAIYPGTVVFSEYLRGYGLLVLLDHGKGDMTLYGFNQTLLKKEGDKVRAGEVIALAGDTGGQTSPSLYFEIRRNSKAENPLRWLSRSR